MIYDVINNCLNRKNLTINEEDYDDSLKNK